MGDTLSSGFLIMKSIYTVLGFIALWYMFLNVINFDKKQLALLIVGLLFLFFSGGIMVVFLLCVVSGLSSRNKIFKAIEDGKELKGLNTSSSYLTTFFSGIKIGIFLCSVIGLCILSFFAIFHLVLINIFEIKETFDEYLKYFTQYIKLSGFITIGFGIYAIRLKSIVNHFEYNLSNKELKDSMDLDINLDFKNEVDIPTEKLDK